jgi:tetrahydromethanopterin S-methyltransferase subunit E
MIELMLLGQVGVFIHYFKEWVVANNNQKNYDLKKAVPMAALSSLTTAILVYLKNDIESLYVVTKFGAVILGYIGNSIFFSFVDAKKPKVAEPPVKLDA